MINKRLISWTFAFTLCCQCVLVYAEIGVRSDHPGRYIVVKGDTLWDISERFLNTPWLWPEVWHANPQIANPHLIYPGDVITLIYVDGKPRLILERGGNTSVKRSPHIRAESAVTAIPTIPIDAIYPFISRPMIVSEDELENAPYVVDTTDERIVVATGDRVYVRTLSEEDGERFVLVRKGKEYRDTPDDNRLGRLQGELLGIEATFIGNARLLAFGDPATLTITDSAREAIAGDRVFPWSEDAFDRHFIPHSPDSDIQGRIIGVLDGVTQVGQYDVITLNLGEREGIETGHVLAIYKKGRTIRDPFAKSKMNNEMVTLPNEHAGYLMVFRTFEKLSYALIMRATNAIHVGDVVKNP